MYMTYVYMLWRLLICLFKRSSYSFNIYDHINFGFPFFSPVSVKDGLRETAKRQTEHSSTLRRWILTLTWLRLTWKRYVSSRAADTNHTSLSHLFHFLKHSFPFWLPGLRHSPKEHPPRPFHCFSFAFIAPFPCPQPPIPMSFKRH